MRAWWVAVVGWIGVIFFSSTSTASRWCESAFGALSEFLLSGIPRDSSSFGMIHLIADKGLHVTLFAVLAVLLFRALVNPQGKVVRILSFGLVVGCCSEYLQSFFPDRDPAVRDVLINVAGTGLGVLISRMFRAKQTAAEAKESREYTFSHSDGQ